MYKLSTKLDTIEWHSEQIAREPRGGHRGLLVLRRRFQKCSKNI